MGRDDSGTIGILLCRISTAYAATNATILPMLDGSENPVAMMHGEGFRGIRPCGGRAELQNGRLESPTGVRFALFIMCPTTRRHFRIFLRVGNGGLHVRLSM
jgi:hypothetical protein